MSTPVIVPAPVEEGSSAPPPASVALTSSQQKYISTLHKKVVDFQNSAQAELNRLNGHLQEALAFVREELGVPENHPYALTENASHLVHTPQATAPSTGGPVPVPPTQG
jgi:hypothetical protein